MFDWCASGDHANCKRQFEKFYIGPKNNVIFLDEIVKCDCRKRGCKCYTRPADRPKARKRAVRKKK